MSGAVGQAASPGRSISKLVSFAGRGLVRMVNLTSAAGALVCFYEALRAGHPAPIAWLSVRSFPLGWPTLPLPNVIAWPVQAGMMLAIPATGFESAKHRGLVLAGAGVALLLLAVVLSAFRQDYRNWGAKLAIVLFLAAFGLNLTDLFRCVWLPASWDAAPLVPGVAALHALPNGTALRAGEIICTVYLLSLWRVMSANAVRADLFGPLWVIMRKLLLGTTLRLSLVVMFLPWIKSGAQKLANEFLNGSKDADLEYITGPIVITAAAICLIGVFQHVLDLLQYLSQVLKMAPPAPPPPPPSNNPYL